MVARFTSSGHCVLAFLQLARSLPVFSLVLEWVHKRRIQFQQYLDDWLVITVCSSLTLTLRAAPPTVFRPGGGHQFGDVRPRSFQHGSVPWNADKTPSEMGSSERLLDCQILDLAAKFLLLLAAPVEMWQQFWATWPPWNNLFSGVEPGCVLLCSS